MEQKNWKTVWGKSQEWLWTQKSDGFGQTIRQNKHKQLQEYQKCIAQHQHTTTNNMFVSFQIHRENCK